MGEETPTGNTKEKKEGVAYSFSSCFQLVTIELGTVVKKGVPRICKSHECLGKKAF